MFNDIGSEWTALYYLEDEKIIPVLFDYMVCYGFGKLETDYYDNVWESEMELEDSFWKE